MIFNRMFNTTIPTVPHAEQELHFAALEHTVRFSLIILYFSMQCMKTMFVSSLPPVACRKTHVLLCCLCLFAYRGVHHFFSIICLYILCFVLSCLLRFPYKNDVLSVLTPLGYRRAHFLFMLVVFVCVW